MATLLQQLGNDMADVAKQVRRSLVQIDTWGHGGGAGTIWHPDGLVLTNAHVVHGRQVKVTLGDGRVLPARLLAQDVDLDVAALAVDAKGLPTITLGESRRLRPGQLVFACGHPWGVAGAISAGVVIGMGPEWPGTPAARREWIVVSLNLRPGNSGGPLMDAEGRLVGINTMVTGPEVGMAVPVHAVKAFLRESLGRESLDSKGLARARAVHGMY